MRVQIIGERQRRYTDDGRGIGAHAPTVDLLAVGRGSEVSGLEIHQRLVPKSGRARISILWIPESQLHRLARALGRATGHPGHRQEVTAGNADTRGSKLIVDSDGRSVRLTGYGSRQSDRPTSNGKSSVRMTHALAREIQADLGRLVGLVRLQPPASIGQRRRCALATWQLLRDGLTPYPRQSVTISERAAGLLDRFGLPAEPFARTGVPGLDGVHQRRLRAGERTVLHVPDGLLQITVAPGEEVIAEHTVPLLVDQRHGLLGGEVVEVLVDGDLVAIDPAHLDRTALLERDPVEYELPDATLTLVVPRPRLSTDVLDVEAFSALLSGRRRFVADPE